jgi:hypothetical protein
MPSSLLLDMVSANQQAIVLGQQPPTISHNPADGE